MQYMSKSHSVSSHSSQNNSLKRAKSTNDDNPQWIVKNEDAQDFSSVIEEVGDSFGSGDDLLKQFEQYGIKIENVEANDEENDSKLRIGGHHLFIDHHPQRKHCQFDTVLDYSNMAKLKELTFPKSESRVSRERVWQKIKHIEQCIKHFRDFQKTIKIQIQNNIAKLKQNSLMQIQYYHKATLDKISLIKQQQWREKQKLKQQVMDLQKQLSFVTQQKTQLFDTNRVKDEELRSLRSLQEKSSQLSSQKQSKFFRGDLQLPSQSRYFANELQLEYRKQSQIMKSLNAEVQELTKQVEELKSQNKALKLKVKQGEKKLMERSQVRSSNNDKNIQTYNKFLEKIKMLEDEINQMKKKQAENKDGQIQEWKEQIKDQLDQINEFLLVCQERQRKIFIRQKQLQRKQLEAKKLSAQKKKTYEEQKDQFDLGQRRKSNMYNQRSPQKSTLTSSLKFRYSTQPSHPFSEKLVKNSPVQNEHIYSNRPSMGGRLEFHDKGNFIKYHSKNNDPLSIRLNKISSSIQNELNSLRCKN